MESGKDKTETEDKQATKQPAEDAKATAEETEANSQAEDNSDVEVYFDEEVDDQKKSEMSLTQAKAAWRKEQEKRKQKQKQLDEEKLEREKLQRQVEELTEAVGSIKKGAKPTFESCNYDGQLLEEELEKYYAAQKSAPTKPEAPQEAPPVNEEAAFYLYQREQDITKLMPGYGDAKERTLEELRQNGLKDAEGALLYLSDIARQSNVDIAKVVVAIKTRPTLIGEIQRAGNSQIAISNILKEAESKVKTRKKTAIDSQPEPNINNTGPIDNSTGTIAKLRETWVANPNARNYAIYNAAKQKAKANG